ncbi:MAG: FAD-binding protein [Gammaproteobacteria bacterium]|nr:FAD-binding protein [Gammaproteobacteria bacterium]
MVKRYHHKKYQALSRLLDGDVLFDEITRMLYATDASIYQQRPLAVIKPRHRNDCIKLMQYAHEYKLPVIPRAAGTSLGGQVVGNALIADFSCYMNNISEINVEERIARVQPGVILDVLNQATRKFGLHFAADPSTTSRCTVSGVIGNNAWGAHSPMYGTTRDHVASIDAVLSNGENILFGAVNNDSLNQLLTETTQEAKIYQYLVNNINENRELILDAYPQQSLPCNMGYALHVLANQQPWNPHGAPLNLTALLCGSEGSLALTTEATLKLVPIPKHRHMLCCHFETLQNALEAVKFAVNQQANAIELLDDTILNLTKKNLEQQRNRDWIKGNPKAVLLIEFCGDNPSELNDHVVALMEGLGQSGLSNQFTTLINEQTDKAWAIRRAGLGLLMGTANAIKPVTFIEDSAVPVPELPAFISQFQHILDEFKTSCVYYGSVSMGLIHLRPAIDLTSATGKQQMMQLADATADLLKQYGGSLSAKHGDGRVRGSYIKKMLGKQVYSLIKKIKRAFDPHDLLNPNKIIKPLAINTNLRSDIVLSQDIHNHSNTTYLNWEPPNGIITAIEKCNGAATCRKPAGNGTMCPTYMATLDEKQSTRGRANVIRQTIQTHGFESGIAHDNLKEVLGSCLSCKGCRSECPANVDMTRLKIEHLQHYIKNHGTSLRTHIIRHFDLLSHLGSYMPALANITLNSYFIKSLLRYHAKRNLPTLSRFALSRWHRHHVQQHKSAPLGDVILLNNAFSEYYDVNIGMAAIEFLECAGFRVTVSPCFKLLRTALSQGLISTARKRLMKLIDYLHPLVRQHTPVIGLEPAELLTLRDEATTLINIKSDREKLHTINQQVKLFEEFVSEQRYKIEAQELHWKNHKITMLLHGHCHQKALIGMHSCLDMLSMIPDSGVQLIPSGCCGMAGAFGFEQEHHDLSLKIGKLILFPAIRNAAKDTLIVATGTSCRHQIRATINRRVFHPAEIMRNALL